VRLGYYQHSIFFTVAAAAVPHVLWHCTAVGVIACAALLYWHRVAAAHLLLLMLLLLLVHCAVL
jgi:hypothetical protein